MLRQLNASKPISGLVSIIQPEKKFACTYQLQDAPILPERFVATCKIFLPVCFYLHVPISQRCKKCKQVCMFFPVLNLQ